MKPFVKSLSDAELFDKGAVKVWEFGGSKMLDAAMTEIKGDYPDNGRAVNEECDMMYLVISGKATFYLKDSKQLIKEGSVVFIPKGTPYKIEVINAPLKAWMPSSPAWSPQQYSVVKFNNDE